MTQQVWRKRRRFLGLIALAGFLGAASAEAADRPTLNGRLGPPTPETCFWTEREFKNIPERGPDKAAGIVLWNHGQSAGNGVPDWQHGAPPVIQRFAENGWDVLLVQRNENCKGSWASKGKSYVANLVSEAESAKTKGYRRVLVAGQSYGSGTSLGAGGATDRIDGVLAFALSHGRGSCRDARTFKPEMIPQQERYIGEAIDKALTPRILISMGKDDHCIGHSFTPLVAGKLAAKQAAYIHFDENSMPFSGHSAALTRNFAAMFGDCILKFFAQDASPPPGRHVCR